MKGIALLGENSLLFHEEFSTVPRQLMIVAGVYWNRVSGNSYAKTCADNSLFTRDSEGEEVASSQLSADYHALSLRQSSSRLECDSH
jgi:hypothetical protein